MPSGPWPGDRVGNSNGITMNIGTTANTQIQLATQNQTSARAVPVPSADAPGAIPAVR